MKNKIISTFRKLDILGPNVGLEFENSKNFKTNTGAWISFIIFTACAIVGGLFGKEVYERKRPFIAETKYSNENSYFNISNLNMLISIYDEAGNNIKNIQEYLILIPITLFVPVEGDVIINYNITASICKFNTSNTEYFCIKGNNNTDITINKAAFVDNATTLRMLFYKCNSKIQKCAANLDRVFNNLNLVVSHNSEYIDGLNYTSPVQSIYTSGIVPLSNFLSKEVNINIIKNFLESDNGWLLENIKVYSASVVDNYHIIYKMIEDYPEIAKVSINIASPSDVIKITRNYMKIQDLFAKIGGVITAFTLLFKIIFYNYFRFKYLVYLESSQIFESNQLQNRNSNKEKYRALENVQKSLQNQISYLNIEPQPENLNLNSSLSPIKLSSVQDKNSNLVSENEVENKNEKNNNNILNLNNSKIKKNEIEPLSIKEKDNQNNSKNSYNNQERNVKIASNFHIQFQNKNNGGIISFSSFENVKSDLNLNEINYFKYLKTLICSDESKQKIKCQIDYIESLVNIKTYGSLISLTK